jgi:hypothetical protein
MIPNNYKTSLLIPSQLPEFIRDDTSYANFVLFLQAYYEWLETTNAANSASTIVSANNQGVTYATKNLLNYDDIDNTIDEFIQYFSNDFLNYFPPDSTWAAKNTAEVFKLAKNLYQAKGTPASFEFLFRILYNSNVDIFYTKDAVLRASAGNWYVPRSLKLATLDSNFLYISNLRLFGNISKSIATVENSIVAGDKTEVFISNIERLFQSGESVTVVDSNNQPVYFLNGKIVPTNTPELLAKAITIGAETLTAIIVGQISQILIANPGQNYNTGDPVIVYGGLNSNIANPMGATAVVGDVTSGSIQRINTVTEGFGYTTNTIVTLTNSGGAIAIVGGLDTTSPNVANVTLISNNYIASLNNTTIGNGSEYGFFSNPHANANTTLANSFDFISFTTYPVASIVVTSAGGGISGTPQISLESSFESENNVYLEDVATLGILGPIQIVNGGSGYVANDIIVFSGGSGYGAYANVLTVNSNGAITSVGYVYNQNIQYPLGGLGYTNQTLPTITINSANNQAANAVLSVPGILGTDATFSIVTNEVGAILNINLTNPGEDYISAPNVTFKVQDIVVTNVDTNNFPKNGDFVYQGSAPNTAIYSAFVYSTNKVINNANNQQSVYVLRVYNYNQTTVNVAAPLKIDRTSEVLLTISPSSYTIDDPRYNATQGTLTYGDGHATGTATFLDGLVIGQGQYLDSSGQPSGFDVLEDSTYNNYTYQLTLNKEVAKYRKVLLDLLHPSGMQYIGRYAMESANNYRFTAADGLNQGYSLSHYTGSNSSGISISGSFTNPSSNIITLIDTFDANVQQIISPNSTIDIITANGDNYSFEVSSVFFGSNEDLLVETGSEDLLANTGTDDLLADSGFNPYIITKNNVFVAFANVAYVSANANSNVINIKSLTNSYNLINGGVYSNPNVPLMDIVRAGDSVLVANNSAKTVTNINYPLGLIYLNGNIANTVSNGFMSTSRTIKAYDSNVLIYGPIGVQFIPELTTQDGLYQITDQNGNIILTI